MHVTMNIKSHNDNYKTAVTSVNHRFSVAKHDALCDSQVNLILVTCPVCVIEIKFGKCSKVIS